MRLLKKGVLRKIYIFLIGALVIGNFYYFTPKIISRFNRFSTNYIQGDLSDKWLSINDKDYLYVLKRVVLRELDNNKGKRLWWPTAFLFSGLREYQTYSGDQSDLPRIEDFYNDYISEKGDLLDAGVIKKIDNVMHGNVFIYLNKITGEPRYKQAADTVFLFVKEFPKTENGLLPYRANRKKLLLVDTIGMVCPFLANYAKTYDNTDALDIAKHQLSQFIEYGTEKKTGLPYHAYIEGVPGYLGALGWGRGVGWYLMGLVSVLEQLPTDDPMRPVFLENLNLLAATLCSKQKADGNWGDCVLNPDSQVDTSATGMIGWFLEKAVDQGLLPQTYYPILDKAAMGLHKFTTENGFVVMSSGECMAPGKYSDKYGYTFYGQGASLAFISNSLNRECL